MSSEITTAFVNQFGANVYHLSQQKGSRLRNCVINETIKGEKRFFDQIGKATAQKLTSRHADTSYQNTPHSRRMVVSDPYVYADLVDDADKVRTMIDPVNPYSVAAQYALGRSMDDIIIAAASATAYTGQSGSSTASLGNGQKVASVKSGAIDYLNVSALRAAKKILDGNEVDAALERYIAYSALQMENMLSLTEVTNSDYNTIKALVMGELNTFVGFKFMHTERLLTQTSSLSADLSTGSVGSGAGDVQNDSKVLAWAKNGLLLAIAEDIQAKIDVLPTKNYSTQVFAKMDMGATRMEEEMVVEIFCKPS